MLPASLVWSRPEVAGSYAAALAAASASGSQQLVYCYTPQLNGTSFAPLTAGGGDMGLQLQQSGLGGSAVLQQYQLQQQQQQLLLAAANAAAAGGGVQQQHPTAHQAVYHVPNGTALGLQSPAMLPYHIQTAAGSALGGGHVGPGSTAAIYQGALQAALQQQQQHQHQQQQLMSSTPGYLATEQIYLNPAAFAAGQSIGLQTTGQTAGRKRGSDEMLSVVNGEASSIALCEAVSNEPKKARLDGSPMTRPTRVLQFRGLPYDVTESEILQLSLPFGSVTNIVIVKKKNQALVEINEPSAAHAAVTFYSQRSPIIRGNVVSVHFSNHEQISPDDPLLQDGDNAGHVDALDNSTGDEPRTVLRVVVENMLYPVTIDTLRQVFSRYGQVLKIVTFTKNGMLHALIQLSDTTMAQSAKLGLNGQNMYNGCNLLRVDFSKLTELSVRFNNDKTRDYTNPLLPSGDHNVATSGGSDQRLALTQNQLSAAMLAGYGPVLAYASGGHPSAGMMPPGTIFLTTSQAASSVCTVLLVSNLNEEKVTPDALFMLFGVYGDVTRVKIMFNKKDTALVQFSDAGQAQIAMNNLDKLKLWGKQIKVTPSKHNIVQMPKEGQPDAGLTKDFTNSPLHRFKKPNSKNYHNIFPPSATLHLSNIPGTSRERLVELFSEHGTVVGFKFFQKDCKMALLQMGSIEEAAEALMVMHNFQLAETSHLRVSFSKSSVTPVSTTESQ